MLALVGDTSDNVPGVDGVGPKTAKKLLEKYNDIDTIIKYADENKNKRVREGLSNAKDLVYLSKQLVTIMCDVPIEFHIEEMLRSEMDIEALRNDFKDLEMYSLINQVERLSDSPSVKEVKFDKKYETVLKEEQLERLVKILDLADLISFDLETTSVIAMEADIVGISFSIKEHEGFYIPILFPESISSLELDYVLKKLKSIFESNKLHLTGQNIKYCHLVVLVLLKLLVKGCAHKLQLKLEKSRDI